MTTKKLSFAEALNEHLDAKIRLTPSEKRLKRILDLPESSHRRQRVLRSLEANARTSENFAPGANYNWAGFDFLTFLDKFMKVIELLLKIFL